MERYFLDFQNREDNDWFVDLYREERAGSYFSLTIMVITTAPLTNKPTYNPTNNPVIIINFHAMLPRGRFFQQPPFYHHRVLRSRCHHRLVHAAWPLHP